MKKRNDVIDIMRAVGIILVVLGHSCSNYYLLRLIYLFHLPLFFVISGYLYNVNNSQKPWEYIGIMLRAYWKKYVFYASILVIFHNIFYRLSIFEPAFIGYYPLDFVVALINSMIFNCTEPFSGALWFIPILFFSLAVFNFIQSFTMKLDNVKKKECLNFGIVLLLLCIGISLNSNSIYFLYHIQTVFAVLPFILVGYWVKKINKIKPNFFLFLIFLFMVLICMHFFEGMVELSINSLWIPVLFYTCSLMMIYITYCVCHFCSHVNIFKKILVYIGQNTFSIMSFHFVCFKLVDLFVIKYITHNYSLLSRFTTSYIGYGLIYTILAIVLSLIFDIIINKLIYLFKKFINYCLN